jgi:hypothetical protein
VPGGDTSYVFPDLSNAPGALLCVPIPLIPYFRLFFTEMQSRSVWRTRDDWYRAYQSFAELEEQLMAGCMQQLIDEQRRLYRLWDTALNGTIYEIMPSVPESTAAPVITPPIPLVPPASTGETNALRAHVGRLWHLAENSVAGVTAPVDAGVTGAPALTDEQTVRKLLRRLTAGLDGGGDAPADNILVALRGTVQAGTDRNVIDAGGGSLSSLLDQVETLLTEIRDKLV